MSEDCVHHWVIPAGGSRSVVGTCVKCGATHEFRNDLDEDFEMSDEQRARISEAAKRMWAERKQEARA